MADVITNGTMPKPVPVKSKDEEEEEEEEEDDDEPMPPPTKGVRKGSIKIVTEAGEHHEAGPPEMSQQLTGQSSKSFQETRESETTRTVMPTLAQQGHEMPTIAQMNEVTVVPTLAQQSVREESASFASMGSAPQASPTQIPIARPAASKYADAEEDDEEEEDEEPVKAVVPKATAKPQAEPAPTALPSISQQPAAAVPAVSQQPKALEESKGQNATSSQMPKPAPVQAQKPTPAPAQATAPKVQQEAKPQTQPPQAEKSKQPVSQQDFARQVASQAQVQHQSNVSSFSPQVGPPQTVDSSDVSYDHQEPHIVQKQVPMKAVAPLQIPEELLRHEEQTSPALPPPVFHPMDDLAWRQTDGSTMIKPTRNPSKIGKVWPPPESEEERERQRAQAQIVDENSWIQHDSVSTLHMLKTAPWSRKTVGKHDRQWPPEDVERTFVKAEPGQLQFDPNVQKPQWPPQNQELLPSSQAYQQLAMQQVHTQVAKQQQYFASGGKISQDELDQALYGQPQQAQQQQVVQQQAKPGQPATPAKPGQQQAQFQQPGAQIRPGQQQVQHQQFQSQQQQFQSQQQQFQSHQQQFSQQQQQQQQFQQQMQQGSIRPGSSTTVQSQQRTATSLHSQQVSQTSPGPAAPPKPAGIRPAAPSSSFQQPMAFQQMQSAPQRVQAAGPKWRKT